MYNVYTDFLYSNNYIQCIYTYIGLHTSVTHMYTVLHARTYMHT